MMVSSEVGGKQDDRQTNQLLICSLTTDSVDNCHNHLLSFAMIDKKQLFLYRNNNNSLLD